MSDPINTKAIGRRLRNAREQRGLAQQQLAEKAGCSVETASRIERGVISPTFETVGRMARVLGLSLDALVDGGAPTRTSARRSLQRVIRLLEDLDDKTLSNLADFLRGVSAPPRRSARSSARS
jgi:transcriptional regulator with XRE-family HTH domain